MQVQNAGKVITSEDMAITLLSQLPPRFSAFYSALIASGRTETLRWEELVPMVLDQEEQFKGQHASKMEALIGQASPKKGKDQKKKKDDKSQKDKEKESKCHICDKTGH